MNAKINRHVSRGERAEQLVADLFAHAGWMVQSKATADQGPDLQVSRGAKRYAVEVKAAPEGRGDRLVPLWSQACLQARKLAPPGHAPLAVVAAPRIRAATADQILAFARSFAADVAVGVIDDAGLRRFRGAELEELDSDPVEIPSAEKSIRSEPADLFSDLNQWILKVLLAPELPDKLLAAPRQQYANASELARAADVSVMTANRCVRLLRKEGFLGEGEGKFDLVRRDELFRRWVDAAQRKIKEVPMRFLLRGDPRKELSRILEGGRGCLGLFAAADALGFGFVEGVAPHVYVRRLGPSTLRGFRNLVPAGPGEPPDLIIRQAAAPQAVFRAAVEVGGALVSDVLQVWLDVSSHPSRGAEQADLIRRHVLEHLIQPRDAHE